MAPITKSQIKRVIVQKTGKRVRNDASDVLLALNYNLFLKEVIQEAEQLAIKSSSSEILPTHIRLARVKVLKKYRG